MSSNIKGLFIGFIATLAIVSGASAFALAAENQSDSLANDVACSNSSDCDPFLEHCLNGKCQDRINACRFNYECSGGDVCVQGVCQP
jgi:hypothetical protein